MKEEKEGEKTNEMSNEAIFSRLTKKSQNEEKKNSNLLNTKKSTKKLSLIKEKNDLILKDTNNKSKLGFFRFEILT